MSSGTGDKMRGKGEEMIGRVKGAVGVTTDNERLRGEGMIDQAKGEGRQTEGGIKDALDNLGDKIGDTGEHSMDTSSRAENMGTGSGKMRVAAEDLADDKTKRTR